MYRTEVEMVLLANRCKLGIEVDPVTFNKRFEPLQIVVKYAVVELETPSDTRAASAAAAAPSADCANTAAADRSRF